MLGLRRISSTNFLFPNNQSSGKWGSNHLHVLSSRMVAIWPCLLLLLVHWTLYLLRSSVHCTGFCFFRQLTGLLIWYQSSFFLSHYSIRRRYLFAFYRTCFIRWGYTKSFTRRAFSRPATQLGWIMNILGGLATIESNGTLSRNRQ